MSQDLGSTPASPPTDADALAAARAVQHLLHGYARTDTRAEDLPTLSDIPVLPQSASPAPANAGAAAQAPPMAPRFRAVCTCCNGVWETDVDVRRHPEQVLLCPRCAANIRSQTEGLEEITRPLPKAMSVAAGLGLGPAPDQAVHLDSLPPAMSLHPVAPAGQHPVSMPAPRPAAMPAATLAPAFALPADAVADEPRYEPRYEPPHEPPPPQLDRAAATPTRDGPAASTWALAGLGALLLVLGALAGYAWNEAGSRPQATAQPVPRATGPGAAATNTPTTPSTTTSTSGTAQTPQPGAPALRQAPPPGCPEGVAAMGLCNAS